MPDKELKNQGLTDEAAAYTPTALNPFTPTRKQELGDNYSYTAGSKAITELVTVTPHREEMKNNADYPTINGIKYKKLYKDDLTLIIPEINSLQGNAQVMARYFVSNWTSRKSLKADILFSDYLAERGLKDSKEVRYSTRESMKQLSNLKVSLNHASGAFKEGQFIVEPELTSDGHMLFKYGEKFSSMILENASIMPYPRSLYRLSMPHDITAYKIGEKLTYHKFENRGKPNEGSLSMVCLLEASGLPTVEELKQQASRPSFKQKIIKPIMKAIDTLNNLKQFVIRYMDATGMPLTREKKSRKVTKTTYGKRREEIITESDFDRMQYDIDFFMSLYIDFQILEYPEIEKAATRQIRAKAIDKKEQKKAQSSKTATKKATD